MYIVTSHFQKKFYKIPNVIQHSKSCTENMLKFVIIFKFLLPFLMLRILGTCLLIPDLYAQEGYISAVIGVNSSLKYGIFTPRG